jgi:glycyl-tRNA synthetase
MISIEKIVSLAKRRGFVFPGSEIYGGLANTWDFGPLGLALKRNIKDLWWREFVEKPENIYGIDGGIILSPKVWIASGHVENFTDPLVECGKCHRRFRADQLEAKDCPNCGGKLSAPRMFNGMFRTFVGATEESDSVAYLRPETAQAIFINFKNIIDTFHPKLPFGIAQIGKAFRNEITAGNFIFRDIEFEQMELEFFTQEEDWQKHYEEYLNKIRAWTKLIGLDQKNLSEREHKADERSHYSKKTVDFEYDFPFGRKELYGLAYRTDFDLKTHSQKSGVELVYSDQNGKKITPHVIEPSLGVERTMLAILCSAYSEDGDRVVLKLKPQLAPYKAAVFPLLANKEDLVKKARSVYKLLTTGDQPLPIAWDDRGNIGKRYFAQDEIGTPYCITVDFDTLEDDTVTIRDRDTTKQNRVKIADLKEEILKSLKS